MFWRAVINFLRDLLLGRLGRENTMSLDELVKSVADNVVEEAKKAPDKLVAAVTEDTKAFLADMAGPALELGTDLVRAALFAESVEMLEIKELTDEQVAALSDADALQREQILTANATQLAKLAAAEAEHQEALAKVRERTKAFVQGLLGKVGKIGLGLLTTALIP